MNNPFLITLFTVAIMLCQAAVGFFFVKRRMISAERCSDFSKVLMYFCQPCLAIYTFTSSEFSIDKLADVGIFALATLAINAVMVGVGVLILKKRFTHILYLYAMSAHSVLAPYYTSVGYCLFALRPRQMPIFR